MSEWGRPEGESKLYTHEEDVGGFGSKDSLVRQCLGASPLRPALLITGFRCNQPDQDLLGVEICSLPHRAASSRQGVLPPPTAPLTDRLQFYDDDPGVGARRCSMERLVEGQDHSAAGGWAHKLLWQAPLGSTPPTSQPPPDGPSHPPSTVLADTTIHRKCRDRRKGTWKQRAHVRTPQLLIPPADTSCAHRHCSELSHGL